MLVTFDQRFVDIALVEFGVAHQRDHPAGIGGRKAAVRDEIVLRQAGEEGDGDTEADAAGREVDRDAVLGPARIALRAAETAEALQLIERLRTQQVMDRVQHRAGVRLDRDLIMPPERMEIQHRHNRGDRRARRLVAADLEPVRGVAQVVGVVDRPRRQPAQPRLEALEHCHVPGHGVGFGDYIGHHDPVMSRIRTPSNLSGRVRCRQYLSAMRRSNRLKPAGCPPDAT